MVLYTCCMKCHHRNVSDLVPPCLCGDQLIQQLAHHQIASYKNQDDTNRLRFNWLRSSLSQTPPPTPISVYLSPSRFLSSSLPAWHFSGRFSSKKKKKNSSLLVSAFPQPAWPYGRSEAAGFGWGKVPPPTPQPVPSHGCNSSPQCIPPAADQFPPATGREVRRGRLRVHLRLA